MLVKFPRCIVTDVGISGDGEAQYITIIEAGGGEYQFSARPNDREHPLDAAARLQPFTDQLQACEIEAEVSGFILHKDGVRRQLLSLHKLSVKAAKLEAPVAAAK
ncbi:MAG: hypothetical protein K8S97_00035 [Anaerolineae bacterium]|nr:hypothetical protein [Anaerolineae bacterium]